MCVRRVGGVGGGAHGSRIEDPELPTPSRNAVRHLEDGSAFHHFGNFKLESFGRHQELKKPRIRGLPGMEIKSENPENVPKDVALLTKSLDT